MAGEDDMDFLVQRKFEYRMLDFSDQAVREEIREMRMMILERDRIGVLAVSNPLFVKGAFEGEKLIGVIEVATDGHVNYMVHPDYRGLKIATNLLNQAIDDARDGGVNKLVASVIAGSASETILQKAGFADEGMLSSGATKSRNKLYTRNLD